MTLILSTDPLLHQPTKPADEAQLSEQCRDLRPVAVQLVDMLYHHSFHDLSAPQIGIDLSMFVMLIDNVAPRICINPTIIAAASSMEKDEETCASFPGLKLMVNRPSEVMVRYHNLDGNEVTEHLDGLAARTWLRAYDHTIGVCFTDRVSRLALRMAKKKLAKTKTKRRRLK